MSSRTDSLYNRQNISFKLIHHFVVICSSESLSSAAHLLDVRQSNLSLQMNELEEKLGAKLMQRSWRGIELTEAGRFFLTESKTILRRFEKTKETLQQLAKGNASSVVCGTFSSLDYAAFPKAIKRVRATNEGLDVKVIEMSTSAQPGALDADRIHLAVMLGRLPNLHFRTTVLDSTALELIAPSDHRVARSRSPIGVSTFAGEDVWLVDKDVEPALYRTTMDYLKVAGVSSSKVRHVSSLKEMVAQVMSGGGLALTPVCFALNNRPEIVRKSLGREAPNLDILLCYKEFDGSSAPEAIAQGLVGAASSRRTSRRA